MSFFDCICSSAPPEEQEHHHEQDVTLATYECDYDKNPTSLYQAMESEAWVPCLEFFETGKWSNASLFFTEDPLSPERQARTWVTRFEEDGPVRWSQLPLHAALIFGAPSKIIATLVDLYPQGVRCTDDQHCLPLHLAIKYGAHDNIVRLLLESFPDALFTKDIHDRYPTQMEGNRDDRTAIMDEIVRATTKALKKKHLINLEEELGEVKDDLILQTNLNADIEAQKQEVEIKCQRAETVVAMLRSERKDLIRQLAQKNEVGKKEKGIRGFAFGRKKQTVREESDAQQEDEDSPLEPTVSQETSEETRTDPDKVSKENKSDEEVDKEDVSKSSEIKDEPKEERSFVSEAETINSIMSKGLNKPSVQTTRRPKRSFFKGLGAKE